MAFSSCGEQGLPFLVVQGLPTVIASLVAAHGLPGAPASIVVARELSPGGSRAIGHRPGSCGSQA